MSVEVLLSAMMLACGSSDATPPSTDEFIINPTALPIPFGVTATIDGHISLEWARAHSLKLSFVDVVRDSTTAEVLLMHDNRSLQIAYLFRPLRDSIWYAPELFLDTDNDKAAAFQPDDWWFHASASDCAAAGSHDDYTTCTMAADWQTGPSPSARGPDVRLETLEVRIPFSKLGVTTGDEVGLAIRVWLSAQASADWVQDTVFWPTGGSPDRPGTWLTAQLLPAGLQESV
jgi:hypothetical protein